ncbi:MAG TPA: helix-turn-helix domain-containing protein [Candidatus Cybelea sp.]|jgi:DNA-binding HxlR family transcriptional regulator|nr:helix-turn-helix domain-containing protein [Candidatus Cybelea sp.]
METIKLPPLPTDADVYNQAECPSRLILDRIADKWTTLIMGILAQHERRRFNELRRTIGGISQKMLTQTLRDLERDGLVKRTIYPEVPPRVEYELTDLGRTLCGPLGSLTQWAHDHMDEVKRAHAQFDKRAAS